MALNGKTNEEKIWNYLKSKGLNGYGCAGLMGNIFAESGLNSKNMQNSYESKLGYNDTTYTTAVDNGTYTNFVRDGVGYGICQWTYWSRKQNLLNYAKSVGKSIGDLEMQLDFMWKELSEGYSTSVLSVLKTATSILQASNVVLTKYERPADQSTTVQNKRASYGQTYYDKYAGDTPKNNIVANEDGKYTKGTAMKLSANFNSKEFDCKGNGCCSETLVDAKLIEYLQKIRDHFGVPITINSGYRCEKHNAAVGGASKSKHKYGQAADIVVKGVAPLKVAQYAESLGILGIGQYPTFVHIDTRTTKSYWYGSNEEYRSTFGKYVDETEPETNEDKDDVSGSVNTGGSGTMKYNKNNKPLVCMQTQSTCYKGTKEMTVKGVLWHSTGANNPWLKRYVQPSDNASDRDKLLALLGKNQYNNDWNHITRQAGLNCWIGKLEDGTITTVQTMPWNYRPWGCGSGSKGSCNNGWIQFEICEDDLSDKNYFDKVYKEACEVTAYLCDMYNLDPHGYQTLNGVKVPVILCHQDSYKLGLGGNHGDVYHWFKKYGKDMDDVRDDVAALMKSTGNSNTTPESPTTPVNPTVPEAPSTSNIRKNDIVKIASNATYYSGKDVPAWVKDKTWIVKEVSGDRAVIDKSVDGTNAINSPINTKFLTVVTSSGNSNVTTAPSESAVFTPYLVKVTANSLNIRKGAGTNYGTNGVIKNKGIYTIVEEATGKGATKWGLLKSYKKDRNGWISLDYTKRV